MLIKEISEDDGQFRWVQKSVLFVSHTEKEENTVALFDATAREFLLNVDKDDKKLLATLRSKSMAFLNKFNDGASVVQNLDESTKSLLEICALARKQHDNLSV